LKCKRKGVMKKQGKKKLFNLQNAFKKF